MVVGQYYEMSSHLVPILESIDDRDLGQPKVAAATPSVAQDSNFAEQLLDLLISANLKEASRS
jgi:hypothetical protein